MSDPVDDAGYSSSELYCMSKNTPTLNTDKKE